MKRHAAPILAAVLMLLPVLYVGSYLALVIPGGTEVAYPSANPHEMHVIRLDHYRFANARMRTVFWPLEQIDRTLRPRAWKQPNVFQEWSIEINR